MLRMHSTSSNLSSPLATCGSLLSSLPPRSGLVFALVTAKQSPPLPRASCYHCPMQTMRFPLPGDLSNGRAVGNWGAAGLAPLTALSSSRMITKCDSAGGWSGCNLRLLAGSTEKLRASKGSCVGSCLRHYPLQRWADRTQALPSPGLWHLPWDCRDTLGIFISTPNLHCSPQA